ncbi:MAG TPA: hypothetical protein VEV81_05505 [Pyrinomonadaceae bacterium]|nr:hypothetical protein [Pyrinomonadaceae bacterium]
MTDFLTIGRLMNRAMRAGAPLNCGNADGGEFVILEPSGPGWRYYFQFDKQNGAAVNLSLADMKALLAEHGINIEGVTNE